MEKMDRELTPAFSRWRLASGPEKRPRYKQQESIPTLVFGAAQHRAARNPETKLGYPSSAGRTAAGLASNGRSPIIGWMHGDEPDNAQSLPRAKGYGPPHHRPAADNRTLSAASRSRSNPPVSLESGQASPGTVTSGESAPEFTRRLSGLFERMRHRSFDIYPRSTLIRPSPGNWNTSPTEWTACAVGHISKNGFGTASNAPTLETPDMKPTIDQFRSEVWMSIIHGSRGIIYFVHQFQTGFPGKPRCSMTRKCSARYRNQRGRSSNSLPRLTAPATTNRVEVKTQPTGQISVLVRPWRGGPLTCSRQTCVAKKRMPNSN